MADGFDKAKASTDLKSILKMQQDVTTDSKNKKKAKRIEDSKKSEDDYAASQQQSQQRKYDRSKKTHTNSNGNALLDNADSDFAHSVPRGAANSNADQSVQILKKKNKEQGRGSPSENRSTSTPVQNKSSENKESFEVVNSNKRAFKNRKHLPETERSPKDSINIGRKNNNTYNRNSSVDKDQRRNYESVRNGDQEAEHFVRNSETYRGGSRGEKNHPQMNEGRHQMGKTPEIRNNSDNSSKPRASEPEEEELSAEYLLTLEENSIIILQKANPRFMKAKYYCELCDFHLNIKMDCDKHVKEYRHSRKKQLNDMDVLLKFIPDPNQHQMLALTAAVDKIYKEHGINDKEKKQRADVVVRLEKMLAKNVPDVMMFMYGSSLTGLGMKTADINVNLTSADRDKKLTLLLKETYLSLKDLTGSGFSNLRSDFTAKIPGFFLMDDSTGLTVHVIIHCYNAHCSSELLSIYSDFDIRVRKLCVAFRYWANLCGLDQKCDGFIHPQALNLMVIYFLQVINPQLVPLIQPPKVTGDEIGDYRKDAPGFEKMRSKVLKVSMDGSNKMSIGELWFRLLQFYALEFDTPNVVVCIHSNQIVPRNTKPWNSKKLAVEDPYMLKRNVTRMVNNSRIYEYWEDSIRKAFNYFGFPRNAEGESHIPIPEAGLKVANNKNSELCRQADVDGDQKEVVKNAGINVDVGGETRNQSSAKKKDSPASIIALEKASSQASRGESKSSSYSESDGVVDDDEDDSELDDDSDDSDVAGQQPSLANDGVRSQSPSFSQSKLTSDPSAVSDKQGDSTRATPSSALGLDHSSNDDTHARGEKRLSQSSSCSSSEDLSQVTRNNGELPKEKTSLSKLPTEKDCHYTFSKYLLTDGEGPVLVCTYCEKEGHLKNACPEDKLPEVLSLPALTSFHVKVLSETLVKVPAKVGLNAYDLAGRVDFMKNLEGFIQGQFKDANLALFGSTCNGFGFSNSDMDICLTFNYRKVIDKPWLVESLARKLKQCKELMNVQAIPTAKVPIVKFFVRSIRLDGDISFYNILAQHNTKLLLCYSQIDHRVQVLGYAIKNFAKVCDIGDASRGSLSSYAYILMMIYYLQQVTPPVIPVLQELYEGKEKPRHMIEGCDAWFMDDLSQLGRLWGEKGRNKMSIAELWLGFLRFYVEEFNYKELVVSIRQKEPLTRFEKFWNGENIAVEDPFDVSHNLGSGLSRKMNNFIFKTFINGRMLYGSPIDDNMDMFKTYTNPYDYFFDTDLLSENRPPNVRGCRHCGKMGHLARRCPVAVKEKVEQKGLQKQQKQLPQQPPQLSQTVVAQQQKMQPLLQHDTREQPKQPAWSHPQQQGQGSQQQRQQQNQTYQAAQQQKQGSQKQQQHGQPSQSQQQQQQSQPPASTQQQQLINQPPPQQKNHSSLSQQPQPRPGLLQHPQQLLPSQQQQSQPSQKQPSQQDQLQQSQGQRQLLQQEQRQAHQQEEQRPTPGHEEQKQLKQQEEHKAPVQQEEHKAPVQQEELRPPSNHKERKLPAQQEERKQPLQQEERKQPLQQEERKQALQQEERKQALQQEERKQPLQQEERKQPLQQEERKQPLQQEERKQALQQEERKQALQQEERKQALQQEERKQALQQEERKQALQQEERKQALQQEERKQPLQQEERKQALQQEERKQALQQEERKQPLQQEERKQPLQQEEREQPSQNEERRQPSQKEERRKPLQQEEQRHSFELEQLRSQPSQRERQHSESSQHQTSQPSQRERQHSGSSQHQTSQPSQRERQHSGSSQHQTSQPSQRERQHSGSSQHQTRQSPHQDTRQSFQQSTRQSDQWRHRHSPQHPYQPLSPQPQQQFGKPHQQFMQAGQPQFPQPPQKNIQNFQQQRQPSQQQLQQQHPSNLPQHWQHPRQQQPTERELRERDEHHLMQKGLPGNMNVNSSGPGFPFNFFDHPRSVQAGTPTMTNDRPSQVYHNSNYGHQRNMQHGPGIPPISSLGSLPQPLMSPVTRYNSGVYGQRLPPSLMAYPPGFNNLPHNLGSGYTTAGYDNRGPHNPPGTQYSGQGNRGNNNAGELFMNPTVQNIFDSARGQVLNDSSGHRYRQT